MFLRLLLQTLPGRALRLAALGCALAALLAGAGCTDDTKTKKLCQADSDCDPGLFCVDSRCVCKSDAACKSNELCNPDGFCQARVGCETSLDCPAGQFCDRSTGNCLDKDRCTADVQCPLGQVCDSVRYSCVDGCKDAGDCPLGAVCECPAGTSCSLKQCKVGPCGDNSYCRYGETCQEDGPNGEKRCVKDDRGPFCEPCTINAGQDYCTGDGANFCLVDASKGYGSFFCGVECKTNDECPWGFDCSDVLILTESTCGGSGGQCPLRASPSCQTDDDCHGRGKCNPGRGTCECATDADCPGGVCDATSGRCRSECVGGEGDVQGFCTCLQDSDCPTDVCGANGRCSISLKPCDAGVPNSCGNIYCKQVKDPGGEKEVGYCFIGRNCAPTEGVTCDVVRSQK